MVTPHGETPPLTKLAKSTQPSTIVLNNCIPLEEVLTLILLWTNAESLPRTNQTAANTTSEETSPTLIDVSAIELNLAALLAPELPIQPTCSTNLKLPQTQLAPTESCQPMDSLAAVPLAVQDNALLMHQTTDPKLDNAAALASLLHVLALNTPLLARCNSSLTHRI